MAGRGGSVPVRPVSGARRSVCGPAGCRADTKTGRVQPVPEDRTFVVEGPEAEKSVAVADAGFADASNSRPPWRDRSRVVLMPTPPGKVSRTMRPMTDGLRSIGRADHCIGLGPDPKRFMARFLARARVGEEGGTRDWPCPGPVGSRADSRYNAYNAGGEFPLAGRVRRDAKIQKGRALSIAGWHGAASGRMYVLPSDGAPFA